MPQRQDQRTLAENVVDLRGWSEFFHFLCAIRFIVAFQMACSLGEGGSECEMAEKQEEPEEVQHFQSFQQIQGKVESEDIPN